MRAQTVRATWAGLALVFGMQLLAGHAQTSWYSLLGVGAWALWLGVWNNSDQGPCARTVFVRLRGLILVGAGMALGAALAAIQLVPTAEYLAHSDRSGGLDYATLTNLSYHPARLLALFTPNIFGTPADGSYFTNGIYFEDAAYIGFIPLMAACAAIVAWARRRRDAGHDPRLNSVPFWIGLGLVALILSMGKNLPLYRVLYDHVPTFNAFREPVRWLILTEFALAVLAGIGVGHWGRGPRIVFWSRLAAAGGGAMAVLALAARASGSLDSDGNSDAGAERGCTWRVDGRGGPAHAGTAGRGRDRVAAPMASGGAGVYLVGFGLDGERPQPDRAHRIFRSVPICRGCRGAFTGSTTTSARSLSAPKTRTIRVQIEGFFNLSDYRIAQDRWPTLRRSLLPDLNMLDRIPALSNNDPLKVDYAARYIALVEDLGARAGALLRAAGVNRVYGLTPDGWSGENPAVAPYAESAAVAALAWTVPDGGLARFGRGHRNGAARSRLGPAAHGDFGGITAGRTL